MVPVFTLGAGGSIQGVPVCGKATIEFIRNLVYERSRINLGPDKRELVTARLGKRLRAMQIASITDYCSFLRTGEAEDEIANLIDAISTNHTFFFREEHHFEFLRNNALPELAARRRAERWPDPAVLERRVFQRRGSLFAGDHAGRDPAGAGARLAWRIDATDISHRVLDRARAAIYSEESVVGHVPPPLVTEIFPVRIRPPGGQLPREAVRCRSTWCSPIST